MPLGGIFDFDIKSERLVEVLLELENPKIWDNPEVAQALGKERGQLEVIVNTINELDRGLTDAEELLLMAIDENDEETKQLLDQYLEMPGKFNESI